MAAPDCLVCQKHRGEGPLAGAPVWRDELVVVSHRGDPEAATHFPGYLLVETTRHVGYLDELTPEEVGAVATAVWRSARALRAELDPEHVFSLIVGARIAHFHQHVFVRHRGTPEDLDWLAGLEWAGAPAMSDPEIHRLCLALRRHFG